MYKLKTYNNGFLYREHIDKDELEYFNLLCRYNFIHINNKYISSNLKEKLFEYQSSNYTIRIIKYDNYCINISVFEDCHYLEDYDKEFDKLEDVNNFLNNLLKVKFRNKKIKQLCE